MVGALMRLLTKSAVGDGGAGQGAGAGADADMARMLLVQSCWATLTGHCSQLPALLRRKRPEIVDEIESVVTRVERAKSQQTQSGRAGSKVDPATVATTTPGQGGRVETYASGGAAEGATVADGGALGAASSAVTGVGGGDGAGADGGGGTGGFFSGWF